jgi:hypothetical protein
MILTGVRASAYPIFGETLVTVGSDPVDGVAAAAVPAIGVAVARIKTIVPTEAIIAWRERWRIVTMGPNLRFATKRTP